MVQTAQFTETSSGEADSCDLLPPGVGDVYGRKGCCPERHQVKPQHITLKGLASCFIQAVLNAVSQWTAARCGESAGKRFDLHETACSAPYPKSFE